MTFLKKIFGTSWDFHKSAEKISKNLPPSTLRMNLQPPEHKKLLKMAHE
jgi:hypothetical protein